MTDLLASDDELVRLEARPRDHAGAAAFRRARRLQRYLEEGYANAVYPSLVRLPPALLLGGTPRWRAPRPFYVDADLRPLLKALREQRRAAAQLEQRVETPALATSAPGTAIVPAVGSTRPRVPRWIAFLAAALLYCAVLRAAIMQAAKQPDAPGPGPTTTSEPLPPDSPTAVPIASPTASPSQVPTASPSQVPTASPSQVPTASPSQVPTASPTSGPPHVPRRTAPAKKPKPCSDVCNPWRRP